MGWVVNATPQPLYPRERNQVPIVQEAGWAPGPVWTGAQNLDPTRSRFPDPPACGKSLYRLSYRGPLELGRERAQKNRIGQKKPYAHKMADTVGHKLRH